MVVVLKQKEAFRKVLAHYAPSEESVAQLKEMELVILLGISGGGRNTIINHLVQTGKYHFVVSDTTRPPKVRDGELEKNGVHYHFRTEDAVLRDLKSGQYLEAELIHDQQVSGISIRELVNAHQTGKIPINEVDVLGTANIRSVKPDTKFFFVVPPSYDEWLKRLSGREEMSSQELQNRTHTAVRVLQEGLTRSDFRFVVNDNLIEAANRIDALVHGNYDEIAEKNAKDIARGILDQLIGHDTLHGK